MILPGRSLAGKVVKAILSTKVQVQPCGIDLTLKSVSTWSSIKCPTEKISFGAQQSDLNVTSHADSVPQPQDDSVFLAPGSYLVEFNETVAVPLDLMGQLYVRSSLFRAGALVSAGLMDSGYHGAVGGMLQVVNPHGLRLYRDARLAQIVFHEMSESVEGYQGQYQGSKAV